MTDKPVTAARIPALLFFGFSAVIGLMLFPGIFRSPAFRQAANFPLTLAYITVFACIVLFIADSWIKPLSRRIFLGTVVIASLAVLIIYIRGYFPYLDMNGDNAGYILRAQSLLQGRGVRDLHLPGEPWNHELYHVGWSLLLLPFVAVFGTNYSLINIAPLLLTFGSFPLLYFVARRFLPRGLSLAVTLLMAVNQELLHFSSLVMTENPFIFFALLSLFLVMRYEDAPSSLSPRLWPAAFTLFFSYLIRFAGLPLLIACVLGLGLRKGFKKAGILALVLFILVGGFFGLRRGIQTSYPEQFQEIASLGPQLRTEEYLAGRMAELFSPRLGEAILSSGLVLPEKVLDYPYKSQDDYRRGNNLPNFGVLLLALAGAVLSLRFRRSAPAFYFAGQTAFVVLAITIGFPVVDMAVMSRYLIPLIPFLYLFCVIGLDTLGGILSVRPGFPKKILPFSSGLVILLLAGAALNTLSVGIAQSRQGLPPSYANYLTLAEWSREHLPAEAVVGARKDNIFGLVSGRKATMYYYQGTEFDRYSVYNAEMDRLSHLKFAELPVTHVVFDTFSGDAFNKLLPIMRNSPERFTTVRALAGKKQEVNLPERWWMDDNLVGQLPRSAAAILLSYHP